MTRDAEHTPSPQSVVVPLEDWQHVIGALKNAKARLPMGAAIGNVSDALSKVEHLQAAPAPSSLAGGEVTNDQIQSVMLAAIKEVRATVTDATEGACMDADIIRMESGLVDMGDTGWAVMRAVHRRLAALSPEAPAREGVSGADMLTMTCFANNHDNPEAWAAWSRIRAALTPRHEAPDWTAATEAAWAENNIHEAPAEGAGDSFLSWIEGEIDGAALDIGAAHQEGGTATDAEKEREATLCLVRERYQLLRARSSAPEAREGEAVAGAALAKAMWGVDLVPAAPSADKLRVAVEDIAAERQRQIESEKRSESSDDLYVEGELARGAVAYALSGSGFDHAAAREMWPARWHYSWWKPTTPRRDLVKAGALIVAEIERLDRQSTTPDALKAEGA